MKGPENVYADGIIEALGHSGYWITDRSRKVLRFTQGAELIFGFLEKDILGKDLPTMPPGYEKEFEDALNQFDEGQTVVRKETIRQTVTGKQIHVSSRMYAIREDSKVVAVMGIVEDITAQRAAEKALEIERQRIELIFRAMPLGLVIADKSGKIRDINENSTKLFGYSRSEILGLNLNTLIPERFRERHDKHYAEFFKHPSSRAMGLGLELYGLTKDKKEFPVEISLCYIEFEGEPVAVAFVADTTDRTNALRQLLQSQKMEAIGRLAGQVCHDFNNLLTVISGYTAMMLEAKEYDNNQMLDIAAAAERASAITAQLLLFSRREVGTRSRVNPLNILSDLQRLLRRLTREDIELEFPQASGVWDIYADKDLIAQAIMNLAINSSDAMGEEGQKIISFQLQNCEMRHEFAMGKSFRLPPGNYVQITIADTGKGMTPETQDHLFEPFFTTKEAGKGTGLGLTIVYAVVKEHGGKVFVYSEWGKGTTVKMYIPRIGDQFDLEEEPRPPEEEIKGGTETILLAEDDVFVLNLAKSALSRLGYKIIEATNGEEACRISDEYNETIHLLLTDEVMPKLHGSAAALKVKEKRPFIRVLFMSGYAEFGLQASGLGTHFIQKPFTHRELARMVRRCLDEGRQTRSGGA